MSEQNNRCIITNDGTPGKVENMPTVKNTRKRPANRDCSSTAPMFSQAPSAPDSGKRGVVWTACDLTNAADIYKDVISAWGDMIEADNRPEDDAERRIADCAALYPTVSLLALADVASAPQKSETIGSGRIPTTPCTYTATG